MGQHELLALHPLVLGVTDPWLDDPATGAPQALNGVQRPGLTLGIVITLLGDIVFELEVVILQRREVQGETGVPILRGDDFLVTETASVLEQAAVTVDQSADAVARIALLAVVQAGTQPKPDQALDQRATGEQVGLAVVTELRVFLECQPVADGTAPVVLHLAGNDVDHAAHGIGTVQRGHRPTDHLDTLDGVHRRHVHELAVAEVVWSDVTDVALTATIDQYQGVVLRQATHGDADITVLVQIRAHVDTFDITQRIGQAGIGLALQLLTADHADAGRRVGEFLFKTGGRDHGDIQQLYRVLVGQGNTARQQPHAAHEIGGKSSVDRHPGSAPSCALLETPV